MIGSVAAYRRHFFGESVGLETIFRGVFDADGQLADDSIFQFSPAWKDDEVALRFNLAAGKLPFVTDQDGQHITTLEGLRSEVRSMLFAFSHL